MSSVVPVALIPVLRVALAARAGFGRVPALDLLELLAFVRPAQFCVPTARGLATALDLGLPSGLVAAAAALNVVIDAFRHIGWSEKSAGSWEPIKAGDQLAVTPQTPLRVRGVFRYWSIDVTDRVSTHTSRTRRLPHLRDTAGGCNFAFDAFRRLPPHLDRGRA